MKKFFGILFISLGVICLPDCISFDPAEMIGRLIGNALFTFLPGILLLYSSGKKKNKNSGDFNK